MGAIGTVARGYDVGYLLKESSKGLDSGYYLSAVDSIGEPPGVWTGRGCAELGLTAGGEVEPAVMERIYGKLLDPRDPAFADDRVPGKEKAHLGAPPRQYKTADQHLAELLEREPDAGPERRKVLEIEASRKARQAVVFFDYTFPSSGLRLLPRNLALVHPARRKKPKPAGDPARGQGARRTSEPGRLGGPHLHGCSGPDSLRGSAPSQVAAEPVLARRREGLINLIGSGREVLL